MENLKNPLPNLRYTRDVAYVFAAFTGAGVVFSIALGNLSQSLPFYAALIITLIICMAVLYVIDYGLKKELPYGLRYVISGQFTKSWRSILFTFILFLILGFRVFTSIALTWECRKDVAEYIITAPDVGDPVAAAASQDASLMAALSPIDRDIKALEADIITAEKNAYDKVGAESKRRAGSRELDPWGYHAGVIQAAKSRASSPIRSDLQNKRKLKDQILISHNSGKDKILSNIIKTNATNKTDHRDKVSRNEVYYGYFGVGCMCLALLIEFLLTLGIEAETDGQPSETPEQKKRRVKQPETSDVSGAGMFQDADPSGDDTGDHRNIKRPETVKPETTGEDHRNIKRPETVKPETTGEDYRNWIQDPATGFYYRISDTSFMIEGFNGWYDVSGCTRKIQQYLGKNGGGIGKRETNNRNIKKFNLGLSLLGADTIDNPYAMKIAS